jgi:DUF4097 and DUF4098 domain-containing protein YvlB
VTNGMKRSEQFQLGDRTSLDIEVRSGSVDVRSGAPGRAIVSIDSGSVDDWEMIQLGDSLSIRPSGRRARAVRMLVEVPPGSDVEIKGVSADLTLTGSFGATRLHSVSGGVRADAVSRLELNSVSGDVHVRSVAGDASVTTVSGDVEVREVLGRFTASSASGDIRVSNVGDDVTVGTASGDVRVDRAGGASIGVKCISGDVTVGLPAGIRVEPDISTLSGRTTLPTPSGLAPHSAPRVVRVKLRTVSGNITIERVVS